MSSHDCLQESESSQDCLQSESSHHCLPESESPHDCLQEQCCKQLSGRLAPLLKIFKFCYYFSLNFVTIFLQVILPYTSPPSKSRAPSPPCNTGRAGASDAFLVRIPPLYQNSSFFCPSLTKNCTFRQNPSCFALDHKGVSTR